MDPSARDVREVIAHDRCSAPANATGARVKSARGGARLDRMRLVDPQMNMRRAGEGLPSAPAHMARIGSVLRERERPLSSGTLAGRGQQAGIELAGRLETILHPSSVRFAIRLTPRSAIERVEDVVDGVLKVRVMAPAVEGAANLALIRLLADELGIARSDIQIVAGATSRQKLVVVDGVAAEAIVARWPGLRV